MSILFQVWLAAGAERKLVGWIAASALAFAVGAQVMSNFTRPFEMPPQPEGKEQLLLPGGVVGVFADIIPSIELDLDDGAGPGLTHEARVRSNGPFSIYALGRPEQFMLVRWSDPSRDFVVPLASLQDQKIPNQETLTEEQRIESLLARFRITATQH